VYSPQKKKKKKLLVKGKCNQTTAANSGRVLNTLLSEAVAVAAAAA
jgi:hypothetical protein